MNINRDYLIINDVKKSNIKLDNGSMFFYITDKNTQNIFVNLVINVSNNDLIQKYANIENAEDYTLTMNIVKPDNTYKVVEGKLHDKQNAIFEFDLKEDCCNEIGTYRCELLTKCNINNHEEITTSNKLTYKVKSSVLNDLDDIVEAPEYPLVIQLFDKLSDIEQYEEDRRANELARQLAEEQRQTRFNELNADIDNKMTDIENRISAKEQAVDKLIVDTKADIDDYKVAKDAEIDNYKTAKDTEINNAITTQDNKINEFINERNDRLDALENKDVLHNSRLDAIEAKDTEQDSRLDVAENRLANIGNDITNTMQPIIDAHTSRLDAIEVKNQQQDDRLLDIEKVNSRQDIDIKCLYGASQTIDVTKEGNSIYLQNSNNGFTIVDEIKGNTLVNCNKEPDKEIILNGNINTQGYSNVTLTEGVDGGLVDVALEGNTMVNVCDPKEPVAITKSYTVETGNHVALQGEYDGKCRPVITGNTLVNIIDSFGSVINAEADFSTGSYKCTANGTARHLYYKVIPKTSTTYTAISYVNKNTINDKFSLIGLDVTENNSPITIPTGFTGLFVSKFTTKADNLDNIWETDLWKENTEGEIEIKGFMILEGDYTNKPIPEYFTGLQSSFEDKVVTQEMVDAGEELAENLGKYKVDYVVTGKNKFILPGAVGDALATYNYGNLCTCTKIDANSLRFIGNIPSDKKWVELCYGKDLFVLKKGKYTFSCDISQVSTDSIRLMGRKLSDGTQYDMCRINHTDTSTVFTVSEDVMIYQITLFAPITNTDIDFTLHFQLEEGDTATPYEPYKEYKKTFYLNNPLLEGDTIEQQGDNVVHVHRSELRPYQTDDELTLPTDMTNTLVAKATPQYEVISQNDTILCDSYVNGHLDVDSVVPIEKVDFLHFEGELTYLYTNTQYTVQFVSNAVSKVNITLGGAKLLNQNVVVGINKYMITTPSELVHNNLVFNGIGFNASNIVVTEATDQDFGYFEGMKSVGECEDLEVVSSNSDGTLSNTQTLTHEPLRAVGDAKDKYVLIDGKWYIERKCGVRAYQEGDIDNYITDMINTVYPLSTPQYEPIDYNPFTVYSDITHISNNSTIPCNMTIKNTGYNCLLKPNTTYTVSSNLGLNTVTTPSTLTEDCLRFYDTDTSTVTTMKNVMVLEGDYTTGKPIPSHFSGIESAFEQEWDEAVGKYRVKIRVQNEDASKENYIEFYINEPLRGIGDVKDKVYVKDDKVIVERNCASVTLDGIWKVDGNGTYGKKIYSNIKLPYLPYTDSYDYVNFISKDIFNSKEPSASNIPLYGMRLRYAHNSYYQNATIPKGISNINDYMKNLTIVYQLAEPIYEEVEYNDVKLFIESFKNSTLFYNSNIPVTSTVHYSYSVPIVDTVAQTANATDEQDVMIIDLATQVAVMEMLLM